MSRISMQDAARDLDAQPHVGYDRSILSDPPTGG
jgi:hypothetical protein